MAIQEYTTVGRAANLGFERLDDEMLAMDERAGYFYSMNPTAHRIWELLAQPQTVSALCAQLRQEYDVDEATGLRETLRLLEQLQEARLITTQP